MIGLAALLLGRGGWTSRGLAVAAFVFLGGYGAMAALGELECGDRNDCSTFTDVAVPLVVAAFVAIPVLLVVAVVRGVTGAAMEHARFERRDRGWIAAGVGMLVLAPLVVLGADAARVEAAVMMATVVVMALAPPVAARAVRDEGEAVERAEEGLAFRFSRGRQAGLGVTGLGFAVLGALLAADMLSLDPQDGPSPLFVRVVGALCAVMGLVFGPLNLLEARRGQLVVLRDDALVQRTWAGTVVIPWDAVADVWTYAVRGAAMVGLSFAYPDRVTMPRALRVLGLLGRRSSGADHSIPAVALRAEPERLEREIERRLGRDGREDFPR